MIPKIFGEGVPKDCALNRIPRKQAVGVPIKTDLARRIGLGKKTLDEGRSPQSGRAGTYERGDKGRNGGLAMRTAVVSEI